MSKRKSVDLDQIRDKYDRDNEQHTDQVPAATLVKTGGKSVPRVNKLVIRKIDPDDARPWSFADRIDQSWYDVSELQDLINSMKDRGQDIPCVVRQASGEGLPFELIVGRRRWAAARLIKGFELSVIVKNLTDTEAAALMTSENMDRADISDFERALSFRRLIVEGVFATAEELLNAMPTAVANLNKVKLSNMIRAAGIYDLPEIRQHLTSLRDVKTSVAVKIARLLDEPGNRKRCERHCRKPQTDTKAFLKGLLEELQGRPTVAQEMQFLDEKGRVIFQATIADGSANLKVDSENITLAGKGAFVAACRQFYDELMS